MRRGMVAVALVVLMLASCSPVRVTKGRGKKRRPSSVRLVKTKRPRAADVMAAVREAIALAQVKHKTPEQQQRAAELNAIFERDMRASDGLTADWPGRPQ